MLENDGLAAGGLGEFHRETGSAQLWAVDGAGKFHGETCCSGKGRRSWPISGSLKMPAFSS